MFCKKKSESQRKDQIEFVTTQESSFALVLANSLFRREQQKYEAGNYHQNISVPLRDAEKVQSDLEKIGIVRSRQLVLLEGTQKEFQEAEEKIMNLVNVNDTNKEPSKIFLFIYYSGDGTIIDGETYAQIYLKDDSSKKSPIQQYYNLDTLINRVSALPRTYVFGFFECSREEKYSNIKSFKHYKDVKVKEFQFTNTPNISGNSITIYSCKPGKQREQVYESQHSKITVSFFGHLLTSLRSNNINLEDDTDLERQKNILSPSLKIMSGFFQRIFKKQSITPSSNSLTVQNVLKDWPLNKGELQIVDKAHDILKFQLVTNDHSNDLSNVLFSLPEEINLTPLCPLGHKMLLIHDLDEKRKKCWPQITSIYNPCCFFVLGNTLVDYYNCQQCSYSICITCEKEQNYLAIEVRSCKNGHFMPLFLKSQIPEEYGLNITPCCSECNNPNIHEQEECYYHCIMCKYDRCNNCQVERITEVQKGSLIPDQVRIKMENNMTDNNEINQILQIQEIQSNEVNILNDQSEQTDDFKKIKIFFKDCLGKYQSYREHLEKLTELGEKIIQIKQKKGANQIEFQSLMNRLEDFIEDNFGEVKRKERQTILEEIETMEVSCPEKNQFEQIIKILSTYQQKLRQHFNQCAQQIFIDNIFENEEIAATEEQISQEIVIEGIVETIFTDLSDKEVELLSMIKPLFGVYPRLKQWLFLRKPLHKFMKKITQYFGSTYPFIKSISEQDLVIILCNMLPIDEMKVLGECLANTYCPFPLVYQIENAKQTHILDYLGYFQLAESQKYLVTYIHLRGITDEQSIQLCNQLTCCDSGNGFESSSKSKSLTFNDSVLLLSKIPHQFGTKFAFAKISQFSDFQLPQQDQSESLISSLFVQSSILLIHAAKSDLEEFNLKKKTETQLGVLLELIKKLNTKVQIFLISNEIEENNYSNIKEFHSSVSLLDSSLDSLQIWKKLQQEDYGHQKFDLSVFSPNKQNNKQLQDEKEEVRAILKKIENKEEGCLLHLNMLQKDIMDCIIEGVKLNIHFEKIGSEALRHNNQVKKNKLEETLKQTKMAKDILRLLKYTYFRDLDNNSEEINMDKVFSLKQNIHQLRGKSQDIYENNYVKTFSQIQKLEQEFFEKNQSQNPERKDEQEIQLMSEQIDKLKVDIKTLDKEHQKKEITFDMIINEINIALSKTKSQLEDPQIELILQNFFKHCYHNGYPMQLIEGNTLQFGNIFLNSIAKEIKDENITVISIVGVQSSAKSTLMNYIFQTDFTVGNGRVTKGLYFTKIIFSGKPVLIIDSEGLMSLVGRDQQYDNSIMAFIFLISNIVIFNQKGEANKQVKDLLELCGHIITSMMQSRNLPTVIFAIRDSSDVQNERNINQQKLQIVGNIKTESTSGSMKLDAQNIILFPPAFNEQQIDGLHFKQSNQIFASQVLKLRQLIYKIIGENNSQFKNFEDFYKFGNKNWETLKGNCSNLIIASTLKAYLDEENIKIECDDEIQNQIQTIKTPIFKLINKFNLDLDSQSTDLDKEIKRINILFEKDIESIIDPSRSLVRAFATECIKKYKLNDKNIIQNQMELISSEFERFKQIMMQDLSSKLLEQQIEAEINRENENIEHAILVVIKNMNKDQFSTQQSVLTLQERLKDISKNVLSKQNENFKKKQIAEETKLDTAWSNSVKKLKQQETKKRIKKVYENFYPFKEQDHNYTTLQLYQDKFCLKLRIFIRMEKPIEKDKIEDFINKAQKYKNEKLERIKYVNWPTNQYTKQNWDEFISIITEASYSSIKETFKAQNVESNEELIIKFVLNSMLQELQEIKQKNIEQIKDKQLKQIQGIEQMIKKSILNYKFVLENAGNAQELGKSYSKTLVEQIKNSYQRKIDESINQNITDLLLDYRNPEKNNEHAFAACFDGKKIYEEELLKFYLNTPRYIKDNIRNKVKIPLTRKQVILKQDILNYFDLAEKEIIDSLNSMILTNNQMNAIQFQQHFSSKLKKYLNGKLLSDLSISIEHCPTNTEQKAFLNGILEEIKKSNELLSYANISSDYYFKEKFNEKFSTEISNAIGCKHICPYCGAKCSLQVGHSGGHDAKQTHRLQAYNRTGIIGTDHLSATQCQDSINSKWEKKGKQYNNIHEANEENHPDWVEHFKKLETLSKSTKYEEDFQKRAYVLIGKWFANYFTKLKNKTHVAVIPKEWEQLLLPGENQQIVDINKIFSGYNDKFK